MSIYKLRIKLLGLAFFDDGVYIQKCKNANIGHIFFKLNCGYHSHISYEKNPNACFRFKSGQKLSAKLKDLMIIFCKNLIHAQNLQKCAYDKGIKL